MYVCKYANTNSNQIKGFEKSVFLKTNWTDFADAEYWIDHLQGFAVLRRIQDNSNEVGWGWSSEALDTERDVPIY